METTESRATRKQIWIKNIICLETYLSLSVDINISLKFEQEIVS